MKRYLYISKTKIDMLYPQIPRSILKRLSGQLSINLLGMFQAGVSSSPEGSSVDNLYSKVDVLDKYIRTHEDVGSVENPGSVEIPKPYIADTLPLGRNIMESSWENKFALFAGRFGVTRLVMVGAPDSLIGVPAQAESSHYISDYEDDFYSWAASQEDLRYGPKPSPNERKEMEKELEDEIFSLDLGDWADLAIDSVSRVQPLSFLAVVLLYKEENNERALDDLDEEERHRRVVVASPIYVAFADRSNTD